MTVLEDGDLKLRSLRPQDAPILVELANNEKISINLRDAFPHPYTFKDALNFIGMCMECKPVNVFAIEWDGKYVGNIGIYPEQDVYRRSGEIGYFLGEPYWNKGIMTRAVRLAVEYGFGELDLVRIHTGVFEYNVASQRVLEKCGFVKEGVSREAVFKQGNLVDEIRYALLRKDVR
ncbi:MAG TPA: N-acetyltransferase [Bacteroidetes bacterium]|nr:N-acetyltransferase [Bacteroidota bacterium]